MKWNKRNVFLFCALPSVESPAPHVYTRIAGGIQGMSPQRESRKLLVWGSSCFIKTNRLRRETLENGVGMQLPVFGRSCSEQPSDARNKTHALSTVKKGPT